MTDFVLEIVVGICSGIFTTYIIRTVDKFANKNDRHSPKHGH